MSSKVAQKNQLQDNSLSYTENLIKFSVMLIAMLILLVTAFKIFDNEFSEFFRWYLVIFFSGLSFMPLSMVLLGKFRDSGWIISKALGIAFGGWLMWMLSSVKILKFTDVSCWVCLLLCFGANAVLAFSVVKKKKKEFVLFTSPADTFSSIILAEIVFLTLFIFWNYLKCFNPEAYGTTEKLMDFGFMKAMDKSEYMAPEDLWLSGEKLNYYYVGQFLATYLSKLSGVGVEYGYNLMLMLIAALGFSMPCSIVSNIPYLWNDSDKSVSSGRYKIFPYFAGTLAGVAVSFAGSFHYCLYAKIIPWFRSWLGIEELAEQLGYSFDGYWFPDATRYIGYNPETSDKTIHEFPLYSFVLGDLHAHVINIIFVLCVVAVLLGFMMQKREALFNAKCKLIQVSPQGKSFWGLSLKDIFDPAIIVIGFFIGLFHTTNFWDYPIYFVVSGAIILFVNSIIYQFSLKTLKITLLHAVEIIIISYITCLPFTLSFKQISTEIRVCENHTPLYQLLILWGLPVIVITVYLINLIREKNSADISLPAVDVNAPKSDEGLPEKNRNALFCFIERIRLSDLFVLTLGLCAIGLILIPELIYVKDIYSGDYKRANTMFKLTYQAYILFGISMTYIISKFIFSFNKKNLRKFAIFALVVLLWTIGYFGNSTSAWFGDYSVGITIEEPSDILKGALGVFHIILGFSFVISFMFLVTVKKKRYFSIIISAVISMMCLFALLIMSCVIYEPSDRYKGLNAAEYLENVNYEDYLATNWINKNIEGRPVILEANGNSYTDYNRVSVRTGCPTLLGWKTHEWLWQSDSDGSIPDIITERENAIAELYTGVNASSIRNLIKSYNIDYIYIGGCEREKFDDINYELLLSLGEVVYPKNYDYSNYENDTIIIKLDR